jgi:hypothetical protein
MADLREAAAGTPDAKAARRMLAIALLLNLNSHDREREPGALI